MVRTFGVSWRVVLKARHGESADASSGELPAHQLLIMLSNRYRSAEHAVASRSY